MGTECKLTVLTPTYNRVAKLPELLESLVRQTNKNFQWLVIDDGSQDKTQEWFSEVLKKDLGFQIDYYVKENGGKHTALNFSHQYIKGDYVVVVDSDDVLTENAAEDIIHTWSKYAHRVDVKMIVFQKAYKDVADIPMDSMFSNGEIESTLVAMTNSGMRGDHCETVKTDDFIRFDFPVFEGEKFIGEAWLWQKIAEDGCTIFVNRVLYLCEYLENGLSKSGRALRIKNPLGGMEHARIFLNKKFKFKIRMKQAVLYSCYSLFAKENLIKMLRSFGDNKLVVLLSYPLGLVVYLYWKKKYCK